MPQLHKIKTELFNIYAVHCFGHLSLTEVQLQLYKSLKTEHTVRLCMKSNYLLN